MSRSNKSSNHSKEEDTNNSHPEKKDKETQTDSNPQHDYVISYVNQLVYAALQSYNRSVNNDSITRDDDKDHPPKRTKGNETVESLFGWVPSNKISTGGSGGGGSSNGATILQPHANSQLGNIGQGPNPPPGQNDDPFRQIGIVQVWFVERGYGFLSSMNRSYFFHKNEVEANINLLHKGLQVTFAPYNDIVPGRYVARRVRI